MTHPTNPDGEVTVTDELKPGHCHKCGLQLSDNPHPEAGKPPHYLQVGCPKECIPCLTLSRHQWAGRAMKAENELTDARKLLSATQPAAVDREAVARSETLTGVIAALKEERECVVASMDAYNSQEYNDRLDAKSDAIDDCIARVEHMLAAPLDKDASKPAPSVEQPNPACSLSWNGFNVHGDEKSIREVRAIIDAAQLNKALYAEIDRLKALVPPAPSVEQDERGAFEASFKAWVGQSISFDKVTDDEGDERYADEWLQGAWIGWQARAASTSANVAQAGYKLVPTEPTAAMVYALWDGLPKGFTFSNCTPTGVIASIIAAAPDQSANVAQGAEHPDDVAVDRFAAAMKEKMAAARAKGRYGWQFSHPAYLSKLLCEHVEKGDPRDVANFCMMLWHHQAPIAPPAQTTDVAQGAEAVHVHSLREVSGGIYQCKDCGAIVAAPPAPPALTDAARDVLGERLRQVTAEGWTPAHDDEHEIGELARAAACYAANATGYRLQSRINIWPWDRGWWKPTTPRRDLVKAGALILAEIERLDRRALTAAQSASGDAK